ncbi:hypothetical protein SAMN05216344_10683 [Polaromonas sp. OV174]|nr:hypothetical protein SAMN05216344_10683 [Polaromonas sp. OV174]
MRFHLFEQHADAHLRKSREYLEEANLARVEHQAAAEHHAALAQMYVERIARIEAEINSALQPRSLVTRPAPEEDERPKTESVVVYPARVSRT